MESNPDGDGAKRGNQRRAAELLGIHRPSLTRMLRDLRA